MASGYQNFTCFGNIGQDPELKHTQSGTALLAFRLAVSEDRKVGDEWKEKTEWFSVVVWGKRAEGLDRILNKGDRVMIAGRIENREWEAKDGTKRTGYEVIADKVVLAGGRRQEGANVLREGYGHNSGHDDSGIPF